MSNNGISSHIQMPKLMLKRFSYDKHGYHYYFDVKQGYIGRGHCRTTNTEIGYYSETAEGMLNEAIETPFSMLLQKLDIIDFDAGTFYLDSEFDKITKQFLAALLVRNPKTIEKGIDTSFFLQFFSDQEQHDLMVMAGIDEAEKVKIFDNYLITFTVNKSNTPFVLPISGLYYYTINGIGHLNFPIRPNLAITLVDKKHADKIVHDGVVSMYIINDDKHANMINRFAFRSQYKMGYGRIVSNSKDALVTMQND